MLKVFLSQQSTLGAQSSSQHHELKPSLGLAPVYTALFLVTTHTHRHTHSYICCAAGCRALTLCPTFPSHIYSSRPPLCFPRPLSSVAWLDLNMRGTGVKRKCLLTYISLWGRRDWGKKLCLTASCEIIHKPTSQKVQHCYWPPKGVGGNNILTASTSSWVIIQHQIILFSQFYCVSETVNKVRCGSRSLGVFFMTERVGSFLSLSGNMAARPAKKTWHKTSRKKWSIIFFMCLG